MVKQATADGLEALGTQNTWNYPYCVANTLRDYRSAFTDPS
jgi:hypothetical protein